LEWEIVKGPFWGSEHDKCKSLLREDDPEKWNSESDVIPEEKFSDYRRYRNQLEKKKDVKVVKDGDYVYADAGMHGVYYVIKN
jgi:hypothetical protein